MSQTSRTWIDYLIVLALAVVAALLSAIVLINWPEYSEWLRWGWLTAAGLAVFLFIIFPLPGIVIKRRVSKIGSTSISSEKVLEGENNVRTGLLQAVGTIILALGLIVTFAQVSVTSRSAQDQLALTLKGQISDRFTTAVTQLGDNNIDVRLGGIYALDRIADDSDDYKPTLAAVLSAFVRRNAGRARDKDGNYTIEAIQHSPLDARKPDIQAAIAVLGKDGRWGSRLNGTDIQGLDLSSANISSMDFGDADMTFANFREAIDSGGSEAAVLDRANLHEAIFDEADLTDVSIVDADLGGATFLDATLTGVDFSNSNLRDVDFEGAKLDRANFTGVDLSTCTGIRSTDYEAAVKDIHTIAPRSFA